MAERGEGGCRRASSRMFLGFFRLLPLVVFSHLFSTLPLVGVALSVMLAQDVARRPHGSPCMRRRVRTGGGTATAGGKPGLRGASE